jgi:ATP-dependent Clp protease ATP-binding subunit ClpA
MPQPSADQLQSIPMSPNLTQSLGRAKEFAREQAHRALLLEHLLLALTEDPEASGVLRACNIDMVRLSTDVSGYLGRLTEDMRATPGTEPGLDAELLRVLEAARQAAQQSRRRAIDGAIVLAAIVGDGKSPAAGLLKAHGMTFDEAIKTLQKASAQARTKQYSAGGSRAQPEPSPSPVVKEAVREPAPPPAP